MEPRPRAVHFDGYAIDLETRALSFDGREVPLQEKPFRLLLALLERPGRVVSRAELHDVLWPREVHVDREAGLNTAMRKLRGALREVTGRDAELLQTVPRAGYRLRMEASLVRTEGDSTPPAPPSVGRDATTGPRPAPMSTVAVALSVLLVAFGWLWLAARPGGAPAGGAEPMPPSQQARTRYVEARSLIAAMDGDLARARQLLRTVVDEAPEFAPAHAYLAEASARLAVRSAAPRDLEEARRSAALALELDSGSAVAHRVLAMVALAFDWDVQVADERLARALELDPSDPVNYLARASYESAVGRHDRAIAAVRRAVDLEPDSMAVRSDAGHFLLRAGRFREAVSECEMVLRLDAGNRYAHDCLVTAYSSTADHAAARTHALESMTAAGAASSELDEIAIAEDPHRAYVAWKLERLARKPERSEVDIAIAYLTLGDEDRTLAWLERAARARRPLLIFFPRRLDASRLLDEPRYREILRRAGLEAVAGDQA